MRLPFVLLLCLNVISLPISYKIIMKDRVPAAAAAADDKKKSTDLLIKYDKTKKEWQLGKTKVSGLTWDHKTIHKDNSHLTGFLYLFVLQVFMKESLEQRLEKDRDEVRRQAAMIIRAHLLTFSAT